MRSHLLRCLLDFRHALGLIGFGTDSEPVSGAEAVDTINAWLPRINDAIAVETGRGEGESADSVLASLKETLRALEQHLDEAAVEHGLKHRDLLCPCNKNEVARARAAIAEAEAVQA